ncbi:MAG: CoA ester lyase [Polaromonas sp.]|nr:CoA ester lyase [Polaromonas sp.]
MRSLLFVPATSERKIGKAFASDADGVIIDLEDAVALSEKAAARAALAGLLPSPLPLPCWIRINAMSTPFCHLDVTACVRARVTGIVLPKAEAPSDIQAIDWLMSQLEAECGLPDRSVGLIAIIETARGLVKVDDIAAASPRLVRLMFGAIDLAADMSVSTNDADGATAQARFAITRASRAAGLAAPLDTAFTDITGLEELEATTRRARAMGYAGKSCIHPCQVAVVNQVFSASPQELAWARDVVQAFEKAESQGLAAFKLQGEMIDYPVVERARKLLESVSA